MHNPFDTWVKMLDEQELLLRQFALDLDLEKKALLANQIGLIRDAALAKEKTINQLDRSREELLARRKEEFPEEDAPLNRIFMQFPREERRVLEDKRLGLARLSKKLERLNEFNGRCLASHLTHAHVVQSLITMVGSDSRTYSQDGSAHTAKGGGKLVNRSF